MFGLLNSHSRFVINQYTNFFATPFLLFSILLKSQNLPIDNSDFTAYQNTYIAEIRPTMQNINGWVNSQKEFAELNFKYLRCALTARAPFCLFLRWYRDLTLLILTPGSVHWNMNHTGRVMWSRPHTNKTPEVTYLKKGDARAPDVKRLRVLFWMVEIGRYELQWMIKFL